MEEHARAIVERLRTAINKHDLDGVVGCFAADVESVQPAHPARSFRGAEQLRRNWTQILGGVPDLRAELLSCAVTGDRVWTEWHWLGNRVDGARFEMSGVTVQQVRGDTFGSVRFYMEPVEVNGADITTAVREGVTGR